MAIIDPCIIFSNIIWFLVMFISLFYLFTSNKKFLEILKNLKFRKKKIIRNLIIINKLENINCLFIFIYLIFYKWLQIKIKVLSKFLKITIIFLLYKKCFLKKIY